eukprot:TRINITY_DN11799_c0_g1_i1.p2 TRINITY_DN11799_c0_g1~~TRINITY_DN11799_c0_g1_i1.p2  ORF type:complete len:187 (+),score=22.90 TRINITY_DN11799_c0_g1_i1:1567-2127(+)
MSEDNTDLLNAVTANKSDAEKKIWACRLPKRANQDERKQIQAEVTLEDRSGYFAVSTCPITKTVEDRLEQMSLVVTKEHYGNNHMRLGKYICARCQTLLYSSSAKFKGPCIWPSFRTGVDNDSSLHLNKVDTYNNYDCPVFEVYCGNCNLFLGHRFEDGRGHGDDHVDARWRHCVLSLSLDFKPQG